MVRRPQQRRRRGAHMVEMAVVLPLVFVVLLVIIVGGFGTYYSQQVATVAREAARYAAVHGGMYAQETGNTAADRDYLFNNIVVPRAVGMDSSSLDCTVSWDTSNYPYRESSDAGARTTNTVSVTVTYQWLPLYFFGGMTLQSTSVMPMSY